LIKLGRHAEAARAGDRALTLLKEASAADDTRYNLACVYSLSSGVALKDTGLAPGQRQHKANQYAARAVELLAQSQATGSFRNPGNRQLLEKDTDLDPLRSRHDFKNLLVLEQRGNDEKTASPDR